MLLGMPLEGPEVPRYEQICEPSESNSAATVFAPVLSPQDDGRCGRIWRDAAQVLGVSKSTIANDAQELDENVQKVDKATETRRAWCRRPSPARYLAVKGR